MRAATVFALGCYAAVSYADVLDDVSSAATEATSSVASAVESVASSLVEKPTFTVSIRLRYSSLLSYYDINS